MGSKFIDDAKSAINDVKQGLECVSNETKRLTDEFQNEATCPDKFKKCVAEKDLYKCVTTENLPEGDASCTCLGPTNEYFNSITSCCKGNEHCEEVADAVHNKTKTAIVEEIKCKSNVEQKTAVLRTAVTYTQAHGVALGLCLVASAVLLAVAFRRARAQAGLVDDDAMELVE